MALSLHIALALVLAAVALPAKGDARVTRIAIDVPPYYAYPRPPGGAAQVAVHPAFDRLLASDRADDVARARDLIAKDNQNVMPTTLMVLAIRLYDVGLRDDAVFWYYAARDRYVTLARVADMKAPELAGVDAAMKAFVNRAGPAINGYAFCDVQKQQSIYRDALKWVLQNPYRAMLDPKVPARAGDREENLRAAMSGLMASAAKERDTLSSMPNVEEIQRQRRDSGADVKYCWRS